eukprot:788729-Prorocentrum_minimum.AAC.2
MLHGRHMSVSSPTGQASPFVYSACCGGHWVSRWASAEARAALAEEKAVSSMSGVPLGFDAKGGYRSRSRVRILEEVLAFKSP